MYELSAGELQEFREKVGQLHNIKCAANSDTRRGTLAPSRNMAVNRSMASNVKAASNKNPTLKRRVSLPVSRNSLDTRAMWRY